MDTRRRYVDWFRNSAPYINAHRGRVFVVQFDGEAVLDAGFAGLVHDFALLHSLGVRLVLVHGSRPQIERRLAERGIRPGMVEGRRVITAEAMEAVKEAVGAVRSDIEARLSMGLANSPMAGARIRVAGGNFITARPIGVRDGVDYHHSGELRRVDAEAIQQRLASGDIVLVSTIGYSPTGEAFHLRAEDVATALAVELRASKLVFLGESEGLRREDGSHINRLGLEEAKDLAASRRQADGEPRDDTAGYLEAAIRACRNGVRRIHLLGRRVDGALILELFTREGVGTMVNAGPFEATRRATIEDVGGILELIRPLEEQGILVKRSREKLETEIDRFLAVERDGAIIACAALFPFPEEEVAELACLAVDDTYRRAGRGDLLLAAVETEARAAGATRLFVLTTQASHWFKERGFVDAAIDDLPLERKQLYNYERNSKVLIKRLDGG